MFKGKYLFIYISVSIMLNSKKESGLHLFVCSDTNEMDHFTRKTIL